MKEFVHFSYPIMQYCTITISTYVQEIHHQRLKCLSFSFQIKKIHSIQSVKRENGLFFQLIHYCNFPDLTSSAGGSDRRGLTSFD